MTKLLITGGCSFSECISPFISTWPKHLAKAMPNYTHISRGMGSQGNGLISRKIIYAVSQALKSTRPEDILVGVMWSGINRYEKYSSHYLTEFKNNTSNWQQNPTKVVEDSINNWYVFNHHWEIPIVKNYYKNFYDDIGAMISTIEHILRVQWFLKNNNVKYFMSAYNDGVFNDELINHIDVKHLYEMIDMDMFLPVSSEYTWCKDSSSFDFPDKNDYHPGTEQHSEFTEKVILPFLKEKRYIV